jgi:hypothetical protein
MVSAVERVRGDERGRGDGEGCKFGRVRQIARTIAVEAVSGRSVPELMTIIGW